MKKEETKFRLRVDKDLKKLDNCADFSIQQVAILGDADKILCIQGWFCALELKAEDGTPSALQIYKASKVRKAGGIALIAKPSNWKHVFSFLQRLNIGILDKEALGDLQRSQF